jgi:ABC-type Fe3+ transport system substrate-binding protein
MTSDADPGQRLVARGLTDVRSVREILWPAFVAHVGRPIDLDYRQDVDMGRLRGELGAAASGERPDVVVIANPEPFVRDGLLSPLERATPLSEQSLPAWREPDGRWVPIYVQPIVATYNSLYRHPPRSWLELADAPWRGRLAMEAPERMLTSGPAFAELRDAMGERQWRSWLDDLSAGDPLQLPDNERAVLEVATGSRWGGLANWNVARRVRPGSPVRHVFLDPTPLVPAFAAVVDGGDSSDVGRRFVTWLASSAGQAAIARTGRIPASDPGGKVPTARATPGIPASIRMVAGTADWLTNPEPWVDTFRSVFAPMTSTHTAKHRI